MPAKPTTTGPKIGCRKVTTRPRAVEDPLQYTSIPGVAEPVPLRFFGAKCPECGQEISHGSAFLNHERKTIEFWRCASCGAYAFEDYPEIRATGHAHA